MRSGRLERVYADSRLWHGVDGCGLCVLASDGFPYCRDTAYRLSNEHCLQKTLQRPSVDRFSMSSALIEALNRPTQSERVWTSHDPRRLDDESISPCAEHVIVSKP